MSIPYAFYNWAILGDGTHTAVAYDDGREFARSTFTVGTTGEEFLKGVTVSIDVPDFPAPGETGHFVWNESTQHLELTARPTEPVDCTNWTDYEAFEGATVAWVRACLAAGMDIEATNGRGNTPLLHAAWRSPPEVVRALLDAGADVQGARRGARTWTALHSAAQRTDADAPAVMQMVLDAGADPNIQAGSETVYAGWTPLHLAARQLPLVTLLLDTGANPNVRNPSGWTALHYAANTLPVVQLLLARGASPHLADMGGRTPLFEGIYHENVAVVRALLNAGAQVNVQSHTGWTPLHEAVIQHNVELVRLLLDAGADPLAAANNGRTPIDTARRQNQPAIEQILLAASGQGTPPDPPSGCPPEEEGISCLTCVTCCQEAYRDTPNCQSMLPLCLEQNRCGPGTRDPPLPPHHGQCGESPYGCLRGNYNPLRGTVTHFRWQCIGNNGGRTATCEAPRPEPAPIAPFEGTWNFSSTITANCSSSEGEGSLSVRHTGSVSGWFRPHKDTIRIRDFYRNPARYDVTGVVSPTGWLDATFSYDGRHMGSLSGNLYETGMGTGGWEYTAGCVGRWQATR